MAIIKATRPARLAATYVQFSKRIATAIAVFWCVYRILNIVIIFFRPELSTALCQMLSGVDDVMMVSIGFYTGNSVVEKGITGYFGAKSAAADSDG